MVHRVVLAFLVFGLVACGDDGTGDDGTTPCTDETETVAVTVGAGLQPVLSWEPACAMAFLTIGVEEGEDVWGISTDFQEFDPATWNLIVPPVTYGVTPAVAVEGVPPITLVSGVTYVVEVVKIVPPESTAECVFREGQFCFMGFQSFTP